MVKVFLKGGVWKNSEDEVLKAAIQKYGKNQWARVASLLNKKTAKQAKARWHEWLDPSIRKTEWSRPEEEKLLHLAKLMPAQWKTIALIVGRTAAQCQEHYEYLLDQAAGGGDSATDELRRQATSLRAGQIDSHPETKPAKPDSIDMDDEELEMLQEARARLANTQGKKAKRKQREKMLAQAKRLADLQKRRELKQAGLMSSAARKKAKRSKEIDLGVEIPFHKPAPAGFHDTSDEMARTNIIREKRIKQVDFKQVNENRYRSRDYEEAQRKKKEERRFKMLEDSTKKYAEQEPREEDMPARPRGTLELPAPTITDEELSQLASMHNAQKMEQEVGGAGVTQALLGDYTDRPLPTPMRTPATAGMGRDLMREASQLRSLERGQTPLLVGGDAYDDYHDEAEDERKMMPTNASHLPERLGVGRTPNRRDALGLNVGLIDTHSVGGSTFATSIRDLARQERRATKRARQELEAALAALPAPQFEYELAAPADVVDMEVETAEAHEADQADIEAAERARLQREAERRYEQQSSVLKRKDLPRPVNASVSSVVMSGKSGPSELVRREVEMLLQHDAHSHPVEPMHDDAEVGKKRKKAKVTGLTQEVLKAFHLEIMSQSALDSAKSLVQAESSNIITERVNSILANDPTLSNGDAFLVLSELNRRSSSDGAQGMVYNGNGWSKANSDGETLVSLRLELGTLQEATAALRKKNNKTESKLNVVNGGYVKRSDKLGEEILNSYAATDNLKIEQVVYERLQSFEQRGGADRIEHVNKEVETLKREEAGLQEKYGSLIVEKRRLMMKLKASTD